MLFPETTVSDRAPRAALQERVAGAILDGAARVLAVRGAETSMSDVAAAAGVARATVYRYFPNRQALLDELIDHAVRDAGERLASARIDEVPVPEGVTRAVRALVEVGDPLVVLVRDAAADARGYDERVSAPLRRLVDAGQAGGAVRDDIPAPWLVDALVGLVVSVLSSPRTLGREDTVAAITSLFLDGAARGRHDRDHTDA
jgi:TetR/AcrR family transcriptional regulator, mexCD-oprJ operon repressor